MTQCVNDMPRSADKLEKIDTVTLEQISTVTLSLSFLDCPFGSFPLTAYTSDNHGDWKYFNPASSPAASDNLSCLPDNRVACQDGFYVPCSILCFKKPEALFLEAEGDHTL